MIECIKKHYSFRLAQCSKHSYMDFVLLLFVNKSAPVVPDDAALLCQQPRCVDIFQKN